MHLYNDETNNALTALKLRVGPGTATQLDNCLAEANELHRNDIQRPVTAGDNLVAPAACIDDGESGTLQGPLSAVIDHEIFASLRSEYESLSK